MSPSRTLPALLLPLLLAAPAARACSVPVFRYALERWDPSAFEVMVFHRGPLSNSQKATLARLESPAIKSNLSLSRIDVSEPLQGDYRKVWERQKDSILPWVVVRFPNSDDRTPDAWSGPLDDEPIRRLLDSPARRRLAHLLTTGASAVFVVLTSGDARADNDVTALLFRECHRLRRSVTLPEQSAEGPQVLSGVPLKVSFPIVLVSRTDPAEQGLVRQLLLGDGDLERVRGPIIFPVFGRGRVLGALHGDDMLTPGELAAVARFLCGVCSCRVKELNPGYDLLTSADWVEWIDVPPTQRPRVPAEKPDVPTPEGKRITLKAYHEEATPPPEVVLPTNVPLAFVPPPPEELEKSPPNHRPWLWPALAGALGLVVVTGAWAWRSRGSSARG